MFGKRGKNTEIDCSQANITSESSAVNSTQNHRIFQYLNNRPFDLEVNYPVSFGDIGCNGLITNLLAGRLVRD